MIDSLRDFGRHSHINWTAEDLRREREAEKEIQMRKFRGLTKEGKWVYGWYVEKEDSHGNTYSVIVFGRDFEVIPKTVGQSTGLKDKKRTKEFPEGQEIYKGDITKLTENKYGGVESPINCVVKWNNKGFYQLWRNGIIHWKIWKEDAYFNTGYRKGLEVIGNIHTTPELIKK